MNATGNGDRWSRVLRFPLIRIALAALFVLPPIGAAHIAADELGLGADAVSLATILLAIAAYAAYVRLVEKRRPIVELSARGAVPEVAIGFAIGALLFAATMLALFVLGVAEVVPGAGAGVLASGLLGALAVATIEEVLVRGIVFRIVSESAGDIAALAISAALFGLLHAGALGASIFSTVAIALEAGVLLAAAFMVTRRLWLPIGLHAAWNFTEGSVFGARVSGGEVRGMLRSRFEGAELLTGGPFGPEASLVAVVFCLIAAAALLAVAYRRSHRAG
jgi:uncharacterized protein